MEKNFRSYVPDQPLLFPPSIHDFVPAEDLSHFVRHVVLEELDLSEVYGEYKEVRGAPPYDPRMMTALLLYGYTQGVYSSRKLERACRERVTFMAVTGMQYPKFRAIADFRKRHLEGLSGLFVQVLRLCDNAGLVSLGHVAIDGSKIKANASKHKAMSYGRMDEGEKALKEKIDGWFQQAQQADELEDELYGEDKRGDELPSWVADKEKRREKIREAKEALERQAREEKEKRDKDSDDEDGSGPSLPKKSKKGRKKNYDGVPHPKDQYNFTDPESSIMKSGNDFQQSYNAQIAVDGEYQIIITNSVTNCAADTGELIPLVDEIIEHFKRNPEELSADSDYCSENNLEGLEQRDVNAYIATRRNKNLKQGTPQQGTRVRSMWAKLRQGGHRSRYRFRKQIVEPVFGQIKSARGFQQFLLRGLKNVGGEWSLICTAHNLTKLAKA